MGVPVSMTMVVVVVVGSNDGAVSSDEEVGIR